MEKLKKLLKELEAVEAEIKTHVFRKEGWETERADLVAQGDYENEKTAVRITWLRTQIELVNSRLQAAEVKVIPLHDEIKLAIPHVAQELAAKVRLAHKLLVVKVATVISEYATDFAEAEQVASELGKVRALLNYANIGSVGNGISDAPGTAKYLIAEWDKWIATGRP